MCDVGKCTLTIRATIVHVELLTGKTKAIQGKMTTTLRLDDQPQEARGGSGKKFAATPTMMSTTLSLSKLGLAGSCYNGNF